MTTSDQITPADAATSGRWNVFSSTDVLGRLNTAADGLSKAEGPGGWSGMVEPSCNRPKPRRRSRCCCGSSSAR